MRHQPLTSRPTPRPSALTERDPSSAILANLRLILGTRRGEALAAPALGTVDLTELLHSDQSATRTLEAGLSAAILRHEPRLDRVDVSLSPAPQAALQLTIRAHLRPPLRPARGPIVFHAHLSALGALTLTHQPA
jgi:type VI secretion system protein